MNFFIKKFQSHFVEPKILIGGKWNVAIVHANGEEEFPFGMDMKENLILNNGLDILASNKYYTFLNGLNWNTIPAFLFGDAVNGSGSNPPDPADTELANLKQVTSNIDDDSCEIYDNYLEGSRTFKRSYLFPSPNSPITIREFGIRTRFNQENNTNRLFSRFVIPKNINLVQGQYIKLFYDFTIICPAIVAPIPINVSSGTINGNGTFRLCGRFDDIFGSHDSNGNPVIRFGDSPQSTFMPFAENFCVNNSCQHECFGTGYLIANVFVNTLTNAPIASEWIGYRLDKKDNTIIAPDYVNGNFYRDITYIFKTQNPTEQKQFQGFLFTTTKTDRENTISGWLWQLNNKQTKLLEKEIVIEIRQSMSRINTPDKIEIF